MKAVFALLLIAAAVFASTEIATTEQQPKVSNHLNDGALTLLLYFTPGDGGHVEVDYSQMNMKPLVQYTQFLAKQSSDVPAADSAAIDWAMVINTAKSVWKFVDDNKAVANYAQNFANVLPKGVSSAFELSNWSAPSARSYKIAYKNLLGITILDFTYTVSYTYGGRVDGKGRYLDRVTILPTNVYVNWGWRFDASSSVPSIVNVGSAASPVAGATVELNYKLKALNSVERTESFFVQGDGAFQWLTKINNL